MSSIPENLEHSDISQLSLNDLARLLRSGEIAALTVYEHYRDIIEQREPSIHAFAYLADDSEIREQISALERQRKTRGPLWAIPTADKDLTNRAGMPTKFGASEYTMIPKAVANDNFADQVSATGAYSIGKTTTAEFGLFGFAETMPRPHTANPLDIERGPGGSSTGAGAAVAAGMVPFAAGSDAGGSIRIPAAATGVVGLKVSPGVYEHGTVDLERGPAVPGFLSKNVDDAAYLFAAARPDYYSYADLEAAAEDAKHVRIAATLDSPWDQTYDLPIHPDALLAWQRAQWILSQADMAVQEYRLFTDHKYGESFNDNWAYSTTQIDRAGNTPIEIFSPLTYKFYQHGEKVGKKPGYIDEIRANLRSFAERFRAEFENFDVLVTPALLDTPRPLGWYSNTSVKKCLKQQVQYSPHTSYINVAGCCAITVPVIDTAEALSMSVQFVAAPGNEAKLLGVARLFEYLRGPLALPMSPSLSPRSA